MPQLTEMFWAFTTAIVLATILALVGHLFPGPGGADKDIFRIADGLVTGALGFFAGRAMSPAKPQGPTQ